MSSRPTPFNILACQVSQGFGGLSITGNETRYVIGKAKETSNFLHVTRGSSFANSFNLFGIRRNSILSKSEAVEFNSVLVELTFDPVEGQVLFLQTGKNFLRRPIVFFLVFAVNQDIVTGVQNSRNVRNDFSDVILEYFSNAGYSKVQTLVTSQTDMCRELCDVP